MKIPKVIGNDNKRPTVSPLLAVYNKVTNQALDHNGRSDYTELYKISRPNEDPEHTTWREDNKRRITNDPINRFKSMLVRTFKNSFDEITTDYFADLEATRYNYLDLSNIDPNALAIDWPVNTKNPETPLSESLENGGWDPGDKIDLKHTLVFSDVICEYIAREYLIYEAGSIQLGEKGSAKNYPYYHGIDNSAFWIIKPYYSSKKEVKYETIEWYFHDLGYLPVTELVGNETLTKEKLIYKETYCFPAYEILDETVIAFSTDQVNRIRHLSPKLVIMGEIECPSCIGTGFSTGEQSKGLCGTCKGTKKVMNIGDFSTININPKRSLFDGEQSNVSTPVFYVQPAGGLEYGKTVWSDLLDRAERALCTDPLEGGGNESGVAKALRMEPRQDILEAIGSDFIAMTRSLLKVRYDLLQEKDIPNVNVPSVYNSKSVEMLKHEASNAMPGEKYSKFLKYIKQLYRGNDLMIKIYEYALLYAPLMLYDVDSIDTAVNSGAYSEKDIIRKDYAVYLMKTLLDTPGTDKLSKKQVFELADEMLVEMGRMAEESAMPIEGDSLSAPKLSLPEDLDELEEVLTAFINNEIGKERAILYAMKIEGITREEAIEIIDNIEDEEML